MEPSEEEIEVLRKMIESMALELKQGLKRALASVEAKLETTQASIHAMEKSFKAHSTGKSSVDTTGGALKPIQVSSDTTEVVTGSIRLVEPSAPVPAFGEQLGIAPLVPDEIGTVTHASCLMECPSHEASDLAPAFTSAAASATPTATTDIIPKLATPTCGLPAISAPVVSVQVQLQQHIEFCGSSSTDHLTSKFPFDRPMPWPSYMGVRTARYETRPRPWPSFRETYGCEFSRKVVHNSILLPTLLNKVQMQKAASNGNNLRELPNDLLLNILQRLDTLDAVRTCVLSKQMWNLPTMLGQIVIVSSKRDVVRMNRVLAHLSRPPQIKNRKLQVRFVLTLHDCCSIGKYVGIAMVTHRVDAAEFEVVTLRNSYHCTHADLLNFAKRFSMIVADCQDSFAGMTRLHLQNLRIGDSDIPNIRSTCKQLESLSFFECDTGIQLVLHVEHAGLIELGIAFGKFKTVQLDCLPKLQRMTYSWFLDDNPLVLGFVPQLWKLSLSNIHLSDNTLMLSQLFANVQTVRELYLNFQSEKIWVRPECHRVLAELHTVKLDYLPEECEATLGPIPCGFDDFRWEIAWLLVLSDGAHTENGSEKLIMSDSVSPTDNEWRLQSCSLKIAIQWVPASDLADATAVDAPDAYAKSLDTLKASEDLVFQFLFQDNHAPVHYLKYSDLHLMHRDNLTLVQLEIAWHLDEKCLDYFRWHVAWTLFIFVACTDSQFVLAMVSSHMYYPGVHYSQSNIFEGCRSACYARTLLLLSWNYGYLNRLLSYAALHYTTASLVQSCTVIYGNQCTVGEIISDAFLRNNHCICGTGADLLPASGCSLIDNRNSDGNEALTIMFCQVLLLLLLWSAYYSSSDWSYKSDWKQGCAEFSQAGYIENLALIPQTKLEPYGITSCLSFLQRDGRTTYKCCTHALASNMQVIIDTWLTHALPMLSTMKMEKSKDIASIKSQHWTILWVPVAACSNRKWRIAGAVEDLSFCTGCGHALSQEGRYTLIRVQLSLDYIAFLSRTPIGNDGYFDEARSFATMVHRPWDPGRLVLRHPPKTSAWGQADFQEGRNVMSLSYLPRAGPVSGASEDGLGPTKWPEAIYTLEEATNRASVWITNRTPLFPFLVFLSSPTSSYLLL